jgi:hypothetical protein
MVKTLDQIEQEAADRARFKGFDVRPGERMLIKMGVTSALVKVPVVSPTRYTFVVIALKTKTTKEYNSIW